MADTLLTETADAPDTPATAAFLDRVAGALADHGALLWSAGPLPVGWSDAAVAGDHLLVALHGSSVYVIAIWAEPGAWRDQRDVWRDAGGRCLPSPVLAVDAAAHAVVRRLDAALPADHPFDVHAVVLVHPQATLPVDDRDAEALWREWRVDVCSLGGGDWPTLGTLFPNRPAPAAPVLMAVLDAELPLWSADDCRTPPEASLSDAMDAMIADGSAAPVTDAPEATAAFPDRMRRLDRRAGEAIGRAFGASGLAMLAGTALLAILILARAAP